jgi:hypothetical protein
MTSQHAARHAVCAELLLLSPYMRNSGGTGWGEDRIRVAKDSGRSPKFTLGHRWEIKKIVESMPTGRDLPFSTWSMFSSVTMRCASDVTVEVRGRSG